MTKSRARHVSPEAFQALLDDTDVVGRWDCDVTNDRARADAFVALLFSIDPEDAEGGVPLSQYIAAIHPDDCERVQALIARSVADASPYVTEYRVTAADGRTRWVLARGRFTRDAAGVRGSGIVVDITRMRACETSCETSPLEQAADLAIAMREAIVELGDAGLRVQADALLMELGRRLALQEVIERRKSMH